MGFEGRVKEPELLRPIPLRVGALKGRTGDRGKKATLVAP